MSAEVEDILLGSDGLIYDKPIMEDEEWTVSDGKMTLSTDYYKQITPISITMYVKDHGVEYWTTDGKWINTNKLFARYFFPSTELPTSTYWDTIQMDDSYPIKAHPLLIRIKWKGHKHRGEATGKNNMRYITKSGKYFQLRVASQNYNNRFATLETALQKRKELCGF
jgi:hypothetical protein